MRHFRHYARSLSQSMRRATRLVAIAALACVFAAPNAACAADVTFHINYISELDPFGAASDSQYFAEVWGAGDYAYVGSNENGGGMSIFNIADPAHPVYVGEYAQQRPEDVEIVGNIGYFTSHANPLTGTAPGTGVDVVDLTNPAAPVRLSIIDSTIGGHSTVHTVAVSDGFLYTTDNYISDTIKIFNVADPANPTLVTTLDLGLPSSPTPVLAHQTTVIDGRLYVSSKWNGSETCCGWTNIYDVSNVGTTGPVLLKKFETGARTHSSWPTEDGNALVVAQERSNGQVRIYDISMIDEPNDPDTPVVLSTLTRASVGIDAYSPHNPLIMGDLLFMSWYEAGIQVFNIADPANPIHVGAFDTYVGTSSNYNGAWGVYPYLGLDKVLIGDRARGLIIVDASEVANTGDFDSDGDVDGSDFLAWQRNLGDVTDATRAQGDANRDRKITASDLPIWRDRFGPAAASGFTITVPEGSTLGMALVCEIAALIFRRRRGD